MEEQIAQQEQDRQLVARVARGDQSAFSALYDRLSGPLFSLSVKMLGDAAEAEDALQEACVQIWRRAKTYDQTQSSVFSWAVLITRGKVIDRLRSRGRRLRTISDTTDDDRGDAKVEAYVAETAADTLSRNEDASRVRSILQGLPGDQREAIEMAFFSELTHHDIAQRLNQPLGTVKARIRRGLMRLREGIRRSS